MEQEPVPEAALALFGDRLPMAVEFARHLGTSGVERGLIGPREVSRLWSRHILNCAVIHPAFPQNSSVADIGSGAGLPGVVLAIARPDLRIVLVEPLERRTQWLTEVVTDLGLSGVDVRRGRAEQFWGTFTVDVATSRAVASLGELARLSLPLVRPGGRMLALKGASAAAEIEQDSEILERFGAMDTRVLTFGEGIVDPVSTVVELGIQREAPQVRAPVGDGPARTAARKKAKRRERGRRGTDDQK